MSKKRVLVVHPFVSASGGGNLVAAWSLQALRDDYAVDLATLGPVDFTAVNRAFGTELKPGDFRLRVAPLSYRAVLRVMPTQGAELERVLSIRHALNLDRKFKYDVLFSTQNEADFLRRGLQYVHYPAYYLPRPDIELQWFHRMPGILSGYRQICARLSRGTLEGPRRNATLVNSAFVAERTREWHGISSTIVYPPVPGEFPDAPVHDRQSAFVGVGRIHPVKRWELAVAIVERLRARGHMVTFTLIGHEADSGYKKHLLQLASTRPWFHMLHDLSREQLLQTVARHRYGIHCAEEEHFGIGPAEIQRSGCVLFVHNSGGQVEIVGSEPALTFNDVDDAVEKTSRVLSDPQLETRLREHLTAHRVRFTPERFCGSLRAAIDSFADSFNGREALADLDVRSERVRKHANS